MNSTVEVSALAALEQLAQQQPMQAREVVQFAQGALFGYQQITDRVLAQLRCSSETLAGDQLITALIRLIGRYQAELVNLSKPAPGSKIMATLQVTAKYCHDAMVLLSNYPDLARVFARLAQLCQKRCEVWAEPLGPEVQPEFQAGFR